jgi:hypothetical protein
MKKKTLIIIGIVLLAVIALLFGFRSFTKSHSPAAVAAYHQDGTDITVNYCQPFKKGRLIFGDEASGALQPYGKYWRVGANEATVFETNKDLMNNDQLLKAGKYGMYAYPGKESWEVVFSSDFDRWGVPAPDAAKDILKTSVMASNGNPLNEQFVIAFSHSDNGYIIMTWTWDETTVTTPLKAQ